MGGFWDVSARLGAAAARAVVVVVGAGADLPVLAPLVTMIACALRLDFTRLYGMGEWVRTLGSFASVAWMQRQVMRTSNRCKGRARQQRGSAPWHRAKATQKRTLRLSRSLPPSSSLPPSRRPPSSSSSSSRSTSRRRAALRSLRPIAAPRSSRA